MFGEVRERAEGVEQQGVELENSRSGVCASVCVRKRVSERACVCERECVSARVRAAHALNLAVALFV
eukprot:6181475-Pleurochrysis_carterae.AAC.1